MTALFVGLPSKYTIHVRTSFRELTRFFLTYLFHRVPTQLRGARIFPLSELRWRFPESYFAALKKYQGREHIRQQKIPFLECNWDDVIHLTAVAPACLSRALSSAGIEFHDSFFSFEPSIFNAENTVIYLNATERIDTKMRPDNFAPFVPDRLEKYAAVPPRTIEYYREMQSKGRPPLLFHGIPHVLYRGSLPIESATIVRA